MAVTSGVYEVDTYGQVAPAFQNAPMHFEPVKFGNGVLIEEGSSNLYATGSMENVTANGGNVTASIDSTVFFMGTKSAKYVATAASPQGWFNGFPASPSTTYTMSAMVMTTVAKPIGLQADYYSAVGGTFILSNPATRTALTPYTWTKLTFTFTTGATTGDITPVMNADSTWAIGDTFWVDCLQVEKLAYATSYIDGSQGTGYTWDTATNLITNPDFETNVNGWTGANSATVAQSAVQHQLGTKSMLVTLPTNGSAGQTGAQWSMTLTASTTYTFSTYVFLPSGSVASFELAAQSFGGMSAVATPVVSTLDTWVRLAITFTTGATAASGSVFVLNGAAATAGQIFYVDGAQLEQRSYASIYASAGTANTTTSTRTLTNPPLRFALPATLSTPQTIATWVKLTHQVGLSTTAFTPLFTLLDNAIGKTLRVENVDANVAVNGATQRLNAFGGSNAGGAGNINIGALGYGTVLFLAASHDGATLSFWCGINGAPLTTTSSSSPTINAATSIQIGGTTLSNNVVVENLCVYNQALSTADVTTIYNRGYATDITDDNRIVLVYATPLSRKVSPVTALGVNTGSNPVTRYNTSMGQGTIAPVAEMTATSAPLPNGTTHVINLAATAGIGQGQIVVVDHPSLPGVRISFTVLGVFVGTSTELYVQTT